MMPKYPLKGLPFPVTMTYVPIHGMLSALSKKLSVVEGSDTCRQGTVVQFNQLTWNSDHCNHPLDQYKSAGIWMKFTLIPLLKVETLPPFWCSMI